MGKIAKSTLCEDHTELWMGHCDLVWGADEAGELFGNKSPISVSVILTQVCSAALKEISSAMNGCPSHSVPFCHFCENDTSVGFLVVIMMLPLECCPFLLTVRCPNTLSVPTWFFISHLYTIDCNICTFSECVLWCTLTSVCHPHNECEEF